MPTKLLFSSRAWEDVIYRDELERARCATGDGFEVIHTLTRTQPEGWTGYARRVDAEMLQDVAWPASASPVCSSADRRPSSDTAADGLVGLGYEPGWIRTERFGATG